MSNDVYPNLVRGLGFSVIRRPEFRTIVHESPAFMETRIRQAVNPRWHYELKYNYLKRNEDDIAAGLTYTDLDTMLDFFLDHSGQWDDWLFNDQQTPDYYVGPALDGASPNTKAQLQVIEDPDTGTFYSPLQRRFGGSFYEDIADLNGSVTVYDNAVLQSSPTNYTIGGPGLSFSGYSFAGKYIEWAAEPTAPVTVQFSFYWRCRFEMDDWEIEKFMSMLWGAGGDGGGSSVKFMTVREYE